MKTWIKGGLIGGVIGIFLHLLINFGPLIVGLLFNSRDILEISNISLSYNITRIIVFLIIGFVLGSIVSLITRKIKEKK